MKKIFSLFAILLGLIIFVSTRPNVANAQTCTGSITCCDAGHTTLVQTPIGCRPQFNECTGWTSQCTNSGNSYACSFSGVSGQCGIWVPDSLCNFQMGGSCFYTPAGGGGGGGPTPPPPGWGPCGGCSGCGPFPEQCRTDPGGACVWDSGGCSGGGWPPPAPSCSVVTVPSSITIGSGQQSPISSIVTLYGTNPQIADVTWYASNPSVTSTIPVADYFEPFTSIVTGGNAGSSVITTVVTLWTLQTCQTTTTVNVTAGAPWAQLSNGSIMAGSGNLQSLIPQSCLAPGCDPNFIASTGGIVPGVAVYGGNSYDFSASTSQGSVSTNGWLANTSYAGTDYNYNYFRNLIPSDTVITTLGSNITNAALQTGVLSKGYYWFRVNGNATISDNITIAGNRRVVLLVEGGNLSINGRINVPNPENNFFMTMVNGDIQISPTLTGAGINPAIEGLYMADNQFSTGNGNQQLRMRGCFGGFGGFNLGRDVGNSNSNTPAEIIEHDPRYLPKFPPVLNKDTIIWREVAP